MESQEFIVLYTHQKTKKAKVWQDGSLKLCPSGNKAVLHDDKGACLESLFLKCLEVKPGADLESDRYLITVEEVKAPGRPVVQQEVIEEAPGSRGFVSSGWSRGCQPPGLKRKSTGFQGPRQVPKKMIVTENRESSGSFEAGTAFFPPFCSTLPLFSTVGKKEINNIQTDPESTVVMQTRESQAPFPTTSFEGSLGVPGQEEGLCAPLSSGCQHADPALATEPLRGHSSVLPCPQVSQQHTRSKARILALLKSTPATICEEQEAELPRCSLQMQTPPVCGVGLERCTEVIGTEGPHCQQRLENAVGSRSRWAMYLSPLSSRAAASATGGDHMERQLAVQENDLNLNLEDLLVQERMQAFETCAEKVKKYHEDEPVDTNEYGNQEEKLEIPSFCGSSSLLVSCSSVGKGGLLLEAGICENNKAHFSGNDQRCTGDAARGVSTLGPPGQECQFALWSLPASRHLQAESSVSHDIVDKVSESNTVGESLGSVRDPGGNGTQPFLEVTFDLSNFETSDTEENAQESSSISQDAGIWVRGVLGNGNSCIQKPREGPSCQEISSENLPHLMSVGDKWTEKCFVKESLSKFCDKTCVGLDVGPCEGGNTGGAVAEDSTDAAQRCPSPSSAGSVGGYAGSKEDANGSIPNVGSLCDIALLSSKSKGTEADLHTPDFFNIVTNQTTKNNDLLSHIQTLPFVLGCDLDKDAKQVFPPVSDDENSIQGLDSSQDHSESAALGESNFQVYDSLPNPQETKQRVYRDAEAYIPECEDLGRSPSLFYDHNQIQTARNGSQSWNNPRNSSELSGIVNNISLLKSLSGPSTALESLEMLNKGNMAFPQQGALQAEEPEGRTEVRKPFIRIPFTHVKQDSQQILKENEVEPTKPLQTPLPVEFQGHQVTGSASSGIMIRRPSSQPQCSPCLDSTECEDLVNGCFLLPELTSAWGQMGCSQVASPEQSISTPSPVATYSLDSRHEDFMVEFSEKSLRARTLPGIKRFSSLENKDFLRLPLESKAQVPRAPLPPADGPPSSLHSWSGVSCDPQEPTAGPPPSSEDKPPQAPPPGGWAPEARSAAPFLAEPGNRSRWSRWLKFQSPPPLASAAGAVPGQCSRQGSEAPTDRTRMQAIGAALRGPQPDPLPGQMAQEQGCGGQGLQEISGSELCFPSRQKLEFAPLPRRRNRVPVQFQSAAHYQQTFTSCIIEHLNILLFGLAQRLHRALSKVEATFYTSLKEEKPKPAEDSLPSCHHRQPAKLVLAKKEGPNQGRLFYTCDRPRAEQCKFFKWLEEVTPGRPTREASLPSVVVNDVRSIGLYMRSQKVPLYEECQLLVRKGLDFQRKRYGRPKQLTTINPECYSEPKSKLYLKLSRKESSSTYSKDDLWVISKTLDFELDTFIACSAFFGPSSANEVELLPLKGYVPSRWPTDVVVHALWVCNASSELTTLRNIQEHLDPGTLPLTPHLLAVPAAPTPACSRRGRAGQRFAPPASTKVRAQRVLPGLGVALRLAGEAVRSHGLNEDQAAALMRAVRMLAAEEPRAPPVTMIRGVFGAGKSYLLAVVVLLFVRLFEQSDTAAVGNVQPWKLLISSSTNVAVDRVLLGLLSLGFEKFVRVGSIRKIAKPILPYSLHAGSENENEQLKELQALMKEDLTPAERACVRRSIEQHKLGTTRTLLRQVRVVGVTCASCSLPCMNGLTFPVVVLDECSQMTEPTSLLPIARFECEKLILVGDPKQLPPTIQGSEAAHENGLEQTLFDRLCLMGHEPVPLRTQYRCHPAISAIANDLFYGGDLRDGVSEVERGPLVPWLPILCFYNVTGQEQIERDNSFHNVAEASFTLKLIQSLIASGIAGCMIGVITLYKSQMYKLCHSLSAADFSHPDLKTVQVSTVDAFQGAEKEIIILSCVRTRHVGFIDSETRVNVALTRGRRHLLIVGNLACLRRNGLWGRVIQHCEGREDGLQHASQCEPQLNCFLKDYFEKQAEEKQKKKNEKEKSHSQKDMV